MDCPLLLRQTRVFMKTMMMMIIKGMNEGVHYSDHMGHIVAFWGMFPRQ